MSFFGLTDPYWGLYLNPILETPFQSGTPTQTPHQTTKKYCYNSEQKGIEKERKKTFS